MFSRNLWGWMFIVFAGALLGGLPGRSLAQGAGWATSGDCNITSGAFKTNGITRIAADGTTTFTQTTAGNLRLTGNTLASVNPNGDITLLPNGSGRFYINSPKKFTLGSATEGPTAPMTINSSFYANIGMSEYAANSYRLLGFGFVYPGNPGNSPPAYIGFQETNIAGSTLGDLIFGTRAVTTPTDPVERMRIKSDGTVNIVSGPLAISGTTRIDASGNATLATATIGGIKNWGKLAAAPSGPSEGDEYYNTTTHKKYCYDGTTWQACW